MAKKAAGTAVQKQRRNNAKTTGGVTGKGFKPGQSGNPGGRPKGESITAAIRRLLQQEKGGKVNAEAIAQKAIDEALAGNFQFFKEVTDRADGKVAQPIDLNEPPPVAARDSVKRKLTRLRERGGGTGVPPVPDAG